VISAVVFDLDDTLYPERDFVFGGYRAVADEISRRHGVDILGWLLEAFENGRRGDLFTPALQAHGCYQDEAQVRRLVEVYRGHLPSLRPFDDARAVLTELRSRPALSLGLITDGIAAVQRGKIEALGIASCFDAIVVTDELGGEFRKPHARGYLHCARLLGLEPAAMAYIGDNPQKDFVAARRLGMATLRIRRPRTLHFDAPATGDHAADAEFADLRHAVAYLEPQFA
jgi:putative hydrolase of the HAD superfamily